jgi:magnesium-transporting ATPase (P-type)
MVACITPKKHHTQQHHAHDHIMSHQHHTVRYLIIGLYVGLATVWGFLWWYLSYSGGPRLSWRALTHFQKCEPAAAAAAGYSCDVFSDAHPKTVAMTVLVVVEMFNALNNISENSSLLLIPFWDNPWLLGAIGVSVALHCAIMYVPGLALIFGITHLSAAEWWQVVLLSAPVILVDECLKWASRRGVGALAFAAGSGGGKRGGVGGLGSKGGSMAQMHHLGSVPLASIQVTSPLLGGAGPSSAHVHGGPADKSH